MDSGTEPRRLRDSRSIGRPILVLGLATMILLLIPIARGILSMILLLASIIVAPTLLLRSGQITMPQFMFHYHGSRTLVTDEIGKELSEPTRTRKPD